MADYEISQLAALTAPALGDLLAAVDVSDTTTAPAGAAGSDKQVTAGTLAKAFSSLAGDKVNAQLYGIDPTGTTAIDTIVNGLISGLPAQGGEIFLGEGTFKVSSGLLAQVANSQAVTLRGAAGLSTVLNYYGSGDAVRMYNPNTQSGNYNGNAFSPRSGLRDLTIDGTNASAGAAGLHTGDLMNPRADVIIQNFSGTGSIGLHLDNTVSWTEQADIRASLVNNASNVVFEVSGTGAVSYGYGNYDFSIQAYPGQNGVVFKNGSLLYSSHLKIRGNFGASSSFASNAVLRFTGVAPGGTSTPGAPSQSFGSVFDVGVECNQGPSGATAGPYTVDIDNASGCYINECTGQMNFTSSGGTFHAANAVALGDFQFAGPVLGDSTVNFATITWPTIIEASFALGNFTSAQTLTNGATISLSGTGNVIPVTAASAVTGISVNWGSGGDGQLLFLYNTGSFPIKFAASGTSNVADGTGSVIPPGAARMYVWSANGDLWYATGSPVYAGASSLAQVTNPAGLTSYVQQSQAAATSAVTVTAAAITSLGSLSVPANDPVAGARYKVTAHGTLGTNGTTAPTYICDLRWGGTGGTLITSLHSTTTANSPALPISLSAVPVKLEGEVEFATSTTCTAWLEMTWTNSTTAATAATVSLASITSPVTVTVSSAEALSLDWTWGTAASGTTITIASSSFERVA